MKKNLMLMVGVVLIVFTVLNIASIKSFDDFIDSIEKYKSNEIVVEELPKGECFRGIMNFKEGNFLEVLRRCSYKQVDRSDHEEMYAVRIRIPFIDIRFKILENGIVKYNSNYYEIDPDSYAQLKRTVNFYIMLEKYSLSD